MTDNTDFVDINWDDFPDPDFIDIDWDAFPDPDPLPPIRTIRTIGREVLTFLRVLDDGKYGVKVFKGPDRIALKDAQKAVFNSAELRAVNSLAEYHDVLKALGCDPKVYMVRGALTDPKVENNQRIRRTHKHRDGQKPTLTARRSYLLPIDIDSEDIEGFDWTDPEGAIEAWNLKHPQFRGLAQSWHLSASWGIKPGMRGHVTVEVEEALDDKAARALAKKLYPSCDERIYTPSQPFYFGNPVFIKGAEPVYTGVRFFYRGGEILHIELGSSARELEYWIAKIRGLESGEPRHAVINSAGYFLGRYVREGVWSADVLESKLIAACEDSEAFEVDRLNEAADEIRRAIRDGVAQAPEDEGAGWREDLQRSEEGKVKSTVFNALLILRNHPKVKGMLRYNTRRSAGEWTGRAPWDRGETEGPRRITDVDVTECIGWLNSLGLNLGKDSIHGALNAVAQDTPYDCVLEYLDGLPAWDRVERCAEVFIRGVKAPDIEVNRILGVRTLIGATRRALEPGCKFDTMPILTGDEGIGKSTFWKLLFGGPKENVFSDCIGDYSDVKKFAESLEGYWCVEDGELAKMQTRQLEAVKRALSSSRDSFRPAWGRYTIERPRNGIIAGSSNDPTPLNNDENRRMWTIEAHGRDDQWVIENRDQIWAEALFRAKNGEPCYLLPEENKLFGEVQVNFKTEHPWTESISEYLDSKILDAEGHEIERTEVTTKEVLSNAIRMPLEKQNDGWARKVTSILKKLGWVQGREYTQNQKIKVYRKSPKFE